MIRDPLAELWTLRPRSGSSRSLTVPVRHRGGIVWLSAGQWVTLLYLRRRMRWGRGLTTLAELGAATDAHPGAVTHRLDRLAQLGLIGRHSTPGRGHRTRFWPPRSTGAGGRHGGDCRRHRHGSGPAGGNVATSTPSGGLIRAYVSRGGLIRDAARRQPPAAGSAGGPDPQPGRRRPPRLIYERCPSDGARVLLVAWRFRRTSRRLVASWDGTCPRCGSLVVAPFIVDTPAGRWSMSTVGDIFDGTPTTLKLMGDGRRHRRPSPPSIPPGPRLERIRDLAAEVIAGAEVDADQAEALGARWLGWRPAPDPRPGVFIGRGVAAFAPEAIAGDPAERDELRARVWAEALNWRPVRYSQPRSSSAERDSLVRDSQDAPGEVDG